MAILCRAAKNSLRGTTLMEQKTVTERWSRRQLYSVPKWNRKQLQKDGAEDNCTVFPNETENRGRKMEQKTIVLYSAPKWNRKQGQKNGAEDIVMDSVPKRNSKQGRIMEQKTIQCVQMEQKTGAEKWSGRQL